MTDAPIHATRGGVFVDAGSLAVLRQAFTRDHVVRLPRFLSPELLRMLDAHLSAGTFAPREDAGIAIELCLEESRALDLLAFVMHAPALVDAVRQITGCAAVTGFTGRIYRFDPHVAHHDSWHDDAASGQRLAGFSLNLGGPFRGGEFQLRAKAEVDNILTIANTGPGDAILFRIDPALQHRVRAVEGEAAKTAFAGWFLSGEEEYWAAVRGEGHSGGEGGAKRGRGDA
jgi:hypothetical protein